jgi:hypothetical protein
MSSNKMNNTFPQTFQDELHFVDTQPFGSSRNENNCEDDYVFEFEQSLFEQALDSAEHEEDPWKDLNAEDITVWQETNYEETGSEYTEEVPMITAKPTTPCVIIDNEHGEIRRCNGTSVRRVQELIGVWEIDMDAVNNVNKELHLLGVCSRHFNYDQNTVHSKNLKSQHSSNRGQINCRICFFCNRKKIFSSRGASCIEHTWIVYNQTLQVPCRGMVSCSAIDNGLHTEKTDNSRGVRYVCCQCYEKNGGHLHTRPGSGKKIDPGCTAKHSDDTGTALHHFAKLIETVAQSENNGAKEYLLQALFPCLENLNLDSLPVQTSCPPCCEIH